MSNRESEGSSLGQIMIRPKREQQISRSKHAMPTGDWVCSQCKKGVCHSCRSLKCSCTHPPRKRKNAAKPKHSPLPGAPQ